jgi:hypothetical protein
MLGARFTKYQVDDLIERQALRAREGHGLGDGADDPCAHDLVGGLGGLAGADRTEQTQGLAHRREYGSRAREIRVCAATHDRESALAGALGAAAHRAVEECTAMRGDDRAGSVRGGR